MKQNHITTRNLGANIYNQYVFVQKSTFAQISFINMPFVHLLIIMK